MAIKVRDGQVLTNLSVLDAKVKTALMMYAQTKAPVYEAYMKTHRKWTDRSGFAKTLLNAKVSKPSSNIIRLTLAHGVDYGIWLELANEKNYAILEPTINVKSKEYFRGLENIINKVKF